MAVLLPLELAARLYAEPARSKSLLSFTTLADIVVILSLVLAAFAENLAFLRIVRTLRLLRSYHLLHDLRRDSPWFRRHEDVIQRTVNLGVFIFIVMMRTPSRPARLQRGCTKVQAPPCRNADLAGRFRDVFAVLLHARARVREPEKLITNRLPLSSPSHVCLPMPNGLVLKKGYGVQRTGLPAWATKPRVLVCVLALLGAIAGGFAFPAGSEADVPMYQRRAAFETACKDAANALFRLHLPSAITFADDCRQPKVTPVSNRPGFLIVTRVVEAPNGGPTARQTYSVLMDGRPLDAWRMIEAELAPNELSVVQAPAALSPVRQLQDQ